MIRLLFDLSQLNKSDRRQWSDSNYKFGKCINLNSKERKLFYDPDDIVHSTCSNEDVYKTWLNRVIKNIENSEIQFTKCIIYILVWTKQLAVVTLLGHIT